MNRTATAFQLNIFLLAGLAAVMLALAEGNALPQVVTLPLAVAAFVLTERRGVFYLPVILANLLGLAALGMALLEFMGGHIEARLLSGTHLLVYLSWIVLFQQKRPRHYWWMLTLSLLQVAVGSVLTQAAYYGALLVVFVGLAVWTLSLFTLYQAERRFADRLDRDRHPEGDANRAAENGDGQLGADRRGALSLTNSSSVVDEDVHWLPRRWLNAGFVGTASGTTVASIAVAAAFFLLVPRLWVGQFSFPERLSGIFSGKMTGFSEEVRLGSLGEILESTERVLFVRIEDPQGNPVDVQQYARRLDYDEPLFRGVVLSQYRSGRWERGPMRQPVIQDVEPEARTGWFRQRIRLQPIGTQILPAMQPIGGCELHEPNGQVSYHRFSGVLSWNRRRKWQRPVEYTVYCPPPTGRPGSGQTPRLPAYYETRLIERCRLFPNRDGRLDRLAALAREVSGYNLPKQQRPGRQEMARRLASHLRDSGVYRYSLDMSVEDASVDPVEDFLFNRQAGHCEYYASAMALMLRAVGIPSRLVNGFKGGAVNQFTGEFEVEQRHAHTWVEYYVNGEWITADVTPATERSDSVASLGPAISSWDDFKNLIGDSWRSLVIEINFAQQRNQIYDPVRRASEDWWTALRNPESGATGMIGSVGDFLRTPRRWFSWQGGVFTFVALVILSAAVWTVQRLAELCRAIGSKGRSGQSPARRLIEFYERFRRLCAAEGIVRGRCQTEREFAASIEREWGHRLAPAGLRQLPGELVDSFYRVRFGGADLDPETEQFLLGRLEQFEQSIAAPKRRDNGNPR